MTLDDAHDEVEALLEAGEVDEALDVLRRFTREHPKNFEGLLSTAALLRDVMDEEPALFDEALAMCDRALKAATDDVHRFDALLERGWLLLDGGRPREARADAAQARALAPDEPDAQLLEAMSAFESCEFGSARPLAEALVERHPQTAGAHHLLGLLDERAGDLRLADSRFARAHQLAPEDFPRAVQMSEADFDRVVQGAIDRLPPYARDALKETPVIVLPIPSENELRGGDVAPTVLGVFSGLPLNARVGMESGDNVPATIHLFQRNLQRFAQNREELEEEIAVTLMHEVGHLLGMDEDELFRRGLD